MDHFLLPVFIFVLSLGPVLGEYCRTSHYWGQTLHCSFGCCGSYYNEYCCAVSTGAIVGIVLGSIFGIAFIVAIIRCCVKQHNHRGQMILQTPATGTYVTSHPTSSNMFVVPTAQPTHNQAYHVQYNHVYGASACPGPTYPVPSAYNNQPGCLLPSPYNQGAALQPPPTYSQVGASPPAYSQAGASALTNLNNDDSLPQKPPMPTSDRT